MSEDTPLERLIDGPMRPGRIAWIGLRPARREPVVSVAEATLQPGVGLADDHYHSRTNGPRQVTLIAREHLQAIASFLGREAVEPELTRRNILTEGLNLLALKNKRFRIGDAVLEWTDDCPPCSRMEEALGPGGYNAMRQHGGVTARVLEGGVVRVGDAIARIDEPA